MNSHIRKSCIFFTIIPDQRDFVRVRPRGLAITANSSRQECFNVRSHDDELNERRESFSLTLKLDDTRQLQSGVLVQPNRTEIFIEDDDGMCTWHGTLAGMEGEMEGSAQRVGERL